MVRETMKHNAGKFFLVKGTRFGTLYYQESGTFDVGTPHMKSYLYWTRYRQNARSFETVKKARAMANKLWEEHGERAKIVNRKGMVV